MNPANYPEPLSSKSHTALTRPWSIIDHRLLVIVLLYLITALTSQAAVTVGTFTGGDPGEGLDMQGYFSYAVNVGPSGPGGQVGDAYFTADNVAGVTITANNQIANGGWGACNYGNTDNDKNLAYVMNSIRWAAAPTVVTVQLAVEKGKEYKLQILFHEDCCPGRGFNIVLDGVTELTNFMPGPTQAGADDFQTVKNNIGAVITSQFVAPSNTFTIVLDGPAADSLDITDHNAILNGFTLELLSPFTDVNTNGMADDWEMRNFGNLDQKADGDFDNDGLSNIDEFRLKTDPTKPDTDGDGLTDGEEVHTYHTDPLRLDDTDGDGLNDGAEVTIYKSDRLKPDTDGDGWNDWQEAKLGSDPTDAKSKPTNDTAVVFTGPDKGQGLDLDGTFMYAVNLSGTDPVGQIRDANFTAADFTEGVTLLANNNASNWPNPPLTYGDSAEALVLALLMNSIRWSAATDPIPTVSLSFSNLEVGATYKLQLLFAEDQWRRGFDISYNGKPTLQAFAPFQWQSGKGDFSGVPVPRTNGVALIHTFVANINSITVELDGRSVTNALVTDHNPIMQGATLKLVQPMVDSDHDGLPDAWEMQMFGNLDQTATGDPDGDGLKNIDEFTNGTDPNKADTDGDGLKDGDEITVYHTNPFRADTDGDGLKDGEEVSVYKTDPTKADTDGDGLSDGAEVLTYHTDPLKADTDSDGVNDGTEVRFGSNPLVAELPTEFSNIETLMITGGDPGEGLDLQGNFLYAINVSSAGAAGKAGDADFTADNTPGITVTAANNIANWDTPEYGDTEADNVIEKVTQSIRYDPVVRVDIAGLIPGSKYKLQLLYYEQCCANRGFNVYADGHLIAENFTPNIVQGGVNNTAAAAGISCEFVTHRDKLVIVEDVKNLTDPTLTDPNAILDGFTLEILQLAALPPQFQQTKVTANGVNFTITSTSGKSYTLQYKAKLSDTTWTPVGNAVSATGTTTDLTDTTAAHLTPKEGYWRVVMN